MSRSLNFYRRHRFPEPMINNVYDDDQGKTAYTIDGRVFKNSKIRFATGNHSGREVLVKDFFTKLGLKGRILLLIGEDGKEYRWRLAKRRCEACLALNDALKTPIAKFYRADTFQSEGHTWKSFQGQHMVDEIFALFIYADRLWKSKE
ncbi:hypothetical protein BT96DRAFT_972267 [Gymnopus androsaceus JB14]|uniref:DUF6593 domain-containing protein n=1 Tax=Gymnopus androsaceus JB14 TaxID=1447944 RepID=A0A6A4I522_9AGAR|nr:hypothetical protein BT96DRAFT_972267 [Gymnopus androsaceus JB14]